MRRILAATDFSHRADLALERAAMLARAIDASLEMLHVVDPDRPKRLVAAEADLSLDLLEEQGKLLRDRHGIDINTHLYDGDAFQGIARALDDLQPDLLVLGAYRRRLLQDTFLGTTAERSIRRSRKPVLMVNTEPREPYVHILAAVDLSACAASALRAIKALELDHNTMFSVAHFFEAPAFGSIALNSMSKAEIKSYLAEETALAANGLDKFLQSVKAGRVQRIVQHINTTIVTEIENISRELGADLLVIGAGAGSGPARMLLGSTALNILATSRRDVLVVPQAK